MVSCINCICKSFFRNFQFSCFLVPVSISSLSSHTKGIQARLYSSSNDYFTDPGNPKVALTKDQKTIVMYHPEEAVEYEKTIPIPRDDPRYTFENVESIVKEKLLEKDIINRPVEQPDMRRMFPMYDRDVIPTVMELADMFHTSKHRWFRKGGKRKMKVYNIPE